MVQTHGGPSGEAPENNDETTRIATIIAQQMVNDLPNMVNQLNNNHGGSNNFTFKQFSDAPAKFSGADGATVLLQWFESIEDTLDYINYPENLKVKMAASAFHKAALTWRNAEKATRGRNAALALPWDEFKAIIVARFCPKHETRKLKIEMWDLVQDSGNNDAYTARFHELCILVPHLVTRMTRRIDRYIGGLPLQIRGHVIGSNLTTLEAAMHLSASFTVEYVKAGILTSKGDKKKAQDEVKKSDPPYKKQKTTKHYAAVTPAAPVNQVAPTQTLVRKPYTATQPLCNKCQYHHPTNATCRKCTQCGKMGHTVDYCRAKNIIAPNQPATPAATPAITNGRACFGCGATDQFKNQCPKVNNNDAQALAFVMGTNEAREEPAVVIGTFLINNHYASILFDTGADKSFVSLTFENLLGIEPTVIEPS